MQNYPLFFLDKKQQSNTMVYMIKKYTRDEANATVCDSASLQ